MGRVLVASGVCKTLAWRFDSAPVHLFLGLRRDYTTPTTASGSGQAQVGGGRIALRPDEFTGKSYLDSAKIYLERVGHAVSVEDLLDALKRGGSPVGGKTPKRNVKLDQYRREQRLDRSQPAPQADGEAATKPATQC